MSTRLLLLRNSLRATTTTPLRALSTTAPLHLKENNKDTTAETYERHKQDSIAKQKRGEGHWKAELASNSEEIVKADRYSRTEAEGGSGAGETPEAMIKRMQEETKGRAEETRKHGTSMHDM